MASYFASRTLYKVIAIFELLFSIVIIAFATKTIKLSLDKSDDGWNESPYISYSAALALILGIAQILAAVLLITLTRGPHSFDKDDFVIGITPKFWLFQAVISFGLLLFIFIAPVTQASLVTEGPEMKVTLKELYTYVVVNAFFKLIFMWMVYTTIRCRRNNK